MSKVTQQEIIDALKPDTVGYNFVACVKVLKRIQQHGIQLPQAPTLEQARTICEQNGYAVIGNTPTYHRVDIEYVNELQKLISELSAIDNKKDLSHITFYENGKPITIDRKIIEDWKFVGLGIREFITSGVYKVCLPQITENL